MIMMSEGHFLHRTISSKVLGFRSTPKSTEYFLATRKTKYTSQYVEHTSTLRCCVPYCIRS